MILQYALEPAQGLTSRVTIQVFSIPDLMTNPTLMWKAKQFLGFDYFFEIKVQRFTDVSDENNLYKQLYRL